MYGDNIWLQSTITTSDQNEQKNMLMMMSHADNINAIIRRIYIIIISASVYLDIYIMNGML